jgi:hypothetical protein
MASDEAWPFEPAVDAAAFRALGFADTSAGIARTQRDNREGWWAHARRHRAFILDAAQRLRHPRVVMVLGAGKAYDLPLVELAQRFERVVLVDIDADALAATADAVVRGPLRTRLDLRPLDITGVTKHVARGIAAALERASDADAAEAALGELAASYRLDGGVRLCAEPMDLLVSGMVLSQLGLQPKLAAKRAFETRFGPIREASAPRWSEAWDRFERRVQQDHIDALTSQCALAVLTSDVVHRPTYGQPWTVIGAARLEERLAPFQEIVARAAWSWPRISPRGGHDGVLTEVHAVVLREARED